MSHAETIRACFQKAEDSKMVETSKLSSALYYLLSEKYANVNLKRGGISYGKIRFCVSCVDFEICFKPIQKKLFIRYRHMESIKWLNASINESADKVDIILSTVHNFAVVNIPSPVVNENKKKS